MWLIFSPLLAASLLFTAKLNLFMLKVKIFMTIGPFKINGVPLRRVNQSYVIATSTKVDISGVNIEKFDDKYFSKEVQKKKKKGEGEFFEAEKEVGGAGLHFYVFHCFSCFLLAVLIFWFQLIIVGEECSPGWEEGWPESCGYTIDKVDWGGSRVEGLLGSKIFSQGWNETSWACVLDKGFGFFLLFFKLSPCFLFIWTWYDL